MLRSFDMELQVQFFQLQANKQSKTGVLTFTLQTRFRGSVPGQGSGKVLGQVREGSGAVCSPNAVGDNASPYFFRFGGFYFLAETEKRKNPGWQHSFSFNCHLSNSRLKKNTGPLSYPLITVV